MVVPGSILGLVATWTVPGILKAVPITVSSHFEGPAFNMLVANTICGVLLFPFGVILPMWVITAYGDQSRLPRIATVWCCLLVIGVVSTVRICLFVVVFVFSIFFSGHLLFLFFV